MATESESFAAFESAMARLEEWIDGGVSTARPPERVTPQLPVPGVPASTVGPPTHHEPARSAGEILGSALMAATTTAVVFTFFVVLSMAFLPLPARPSFLP